jgi:hypothetical protein
MPITLNCACGKVLRIPDEHAGKRVRCPACQGILSSTPPAPPKPAFEVVEDEPPARPTARPRAVEDDDDDDGRTGYAVGKADRTPEPERPKPSFRKRADDDDDDAPRPRKKKGPRMSRRDGALAGAETGRRIGFILGGAVGLALGIGLVIWGNSGEGRGATRLMILGGIFAVGGLISLVQGITGNLPDEDEG